jgi:hypothetical protein
MVDLPGSGSGKIQAGERRESLVFRHDRPGIGAAGFETCNRSSNPVIERPAVHARQEAQAGR